MHIPSPMRAFFSDKQGNVILWQFPNAPLVTWFAFTVLSSLLRHTHLRTVASVIAHAAIIIWALLELFRGTTPFRRVLGAIVLVLSVVSIVR